MKKFLLILLVEKEQDFCDIIFNVVLIYLNAFKVYFFCLVMRVLSIQDLPRFLGRRFERDASLEINGSVTLRRTGKFNPAVPNCGDIYFAGGLLRLGLLHDDTGKVGFLLLDEGKRFVVSSYILNLGSPRDRRALDWRFDSSQKTPFQRIYTCIEGGQKVLRIDASEIRYQSA